jgi:cytochrome b561
MDMAIEPQAIAESAEQRYTKVAIALHWAIAVLILYNLASGLLKPVLPRPFFIFHVSSGITILVLTVARIGWRLTHRPPPPLLPIKTWEQRLAQSVHILLYAAMLALPLSGWALVSANPVVAPGTQSVAATAVIPAHAPGAVSERGGVTAPGAPAGGPAGPRGPLKVWGLFKLPLIAPIHDLGSTPAGIQQQKILHERIEGAHFAGGWVMFLLLLLHLSGALKHQFVDHRRQLQRMGIGKS